MVDGLSQQTLCDIPVFPALYEYFSPLALSELRYLTILCQFGSPYPALLCWNLDDDARCLPLVSQRVY